MNGRAAAPLRMFGRCVRVGRPQNYMLPPNGELPPLDVQPLRDQGIISPEEPELGKARKQGESLVGLRSLFEDFEAAFEN